MCTREENIFFCFGMQSFNVSVKSIWSNVSFRAIASVLIFCLDDMSIVVSGVLNSPCNYHILTNKMLMFVICFIYLGVPNLVHKHLQLLALLDG